MKLVKKSLGFKKISQKSKLHYKTEILTCTILHFKIGYYIANWKKYSFFETIYENEITL